MYRIIRHDSTLRHSLALISALAVVSLALLTGCAASGLGLNRNWEDQSTRLGIMPEKNSEKVLRDRRARINLFVNDLASRAGELEKMDPIGLKREIAIRVSDSQKGLARPVLMIHGYNSLHNRFEAWLNELIKRCEENSGGTYVSVPFEYPTGFNWERADSATQIAYTVKNSVDAYVNEEVRMFADVFKAKISASEKRLDPHVARYLVQSVSEEVGSSIRFVLVAHSMGGVVAKHYIHLAGSSHRLSHLVTINTPHYGANWAAPKGTFINLKDVFNVAKAQSALGRFFFFNPVPIIVRTHVPEHERQIGELAYASKLQVDLDDWLIPYLGSKPEETSAPNDIRCDQHPEGCDTNSTFYHPRVIVIGSERDTTVRPSSALWRTEFTHHRELWLNMEHSNFYEKEFMKISVKRICAALFEDSFPTQEHSASPPSKDTLSVIDMKSGFDAPKRLTLYEQDSCNAKSLAIEEANRAACDAEPGISSQLNAIPGALLVVTEMAESTDCPVSDTRIRTRYKITSPNHSIFTNLGGYFGHMSQSLVPHFTNLVNGISYHREDERRNTSCDYFLLPSRSPDGSKQVEVKVDQLKTYFIGRDFLLCSKRPIFLTRNMIWDWLLPDRIVDRLDFCPDEISQGENKIQTIYPARTTVMRVDGKASISE